MRQLFMFFAMYVTGKIDTSNDKVCKVEPFLKNIPKPLIEDICRSQCSFTIRN